MDRLLALYLRHFRNYKEITVRFGPGLNLFHGKNGQGKTNLLEAIYLLSTGKSFRTTHLSELICEGASSFYLQAEFLKNGLSQQVTLFFDGRAKKMQYNQTSYSHFTNLLGLFPTVLMAPEDIELIIGGPGKRRRFLDLHLAQLDPLYVHHMTRYFKALQQRNFLLRSKKRETIEAWENILIHSAAYIHEKRTELIREVKEKVSHTMRSLSLEEEGIELQYLPSLIGGGYEKLRAKEMYAGTTLAGPHRDDISILIQGKEAKTFASQGQKRCIVAALRLAEWYHFYEKKESPPLLSIDDFGIHLDKERSLRLIEEIKKLGQVFITSPSLIEEEVDYAILLN